MVANESKSDFLRECMSDPALVERPLPIDQFCQAFCVVCSQKACTRSRAHTMLFTERVATWKTRLFDNVPRAAENDENYARIRAKNFQSLEGPLVVNSPSEPKVMPVFREKPAETPVHSDPIRPTEIPVPDPAPPTQAQPAPPTHMVQSPEPSIDNTPFQGGIVLPGKPVDKKVDKFVEPGGTFTFGDENE